MAYADVVLADVPTLYYRLGDTSGTTTADSSGGGFAANVSSGVTRGVAGLIVGDANTAFTFNGTSGYLVRTATGDPTAFTVEAWVKTSGAGANQRTVVSRVDNLANIWALDLNNNIPRFFVGNTSAQFGTAAGTQTINDNKPHHLVGTYSGGTVSLYVDGTLTATATLTGTLPTGDADFQVGRQGSAGERYFAGTIDEVAYYGTALSVARVQAHYTAGRVIAFAPPPAVLTHRGAAPQLLTSTRYTPPAATLTLSAPAPQLLVGVRTLQIPPGTLTLSATVPFRHGTTTVPVAALTLRPVSPFYGASVPVSYAIPIFELLVLAAPSVKLLRDGDEPATAFPLTGTGGVFTLDLTSVGDSTDEPPATSGVLEHTAWLSYIPDTVGTLEASVAGPGAWPGVVEVYQQDGTTFTLLGSAAFGEVAQAAGTPAVPLLVRVHPYQGDDAIPDATLTWAYVPRTVGPAITVREHLQQAPGSVIVSLGELDPDQLVTVNIIDPGVSNPVYVTETGEAGTTEFSLPVPTLLAGTYTLEIFVGTTLLLGELVIDTAPLDSTPEPDEFAAPVPPLFDDASLYERAHPRHWKFHDPLTGREWSFNHNPASWSGIERPNWFETDASTAPDGQILTWQAAQRPEQFEFHGYLDSESEYDEFVFWSKLRRRFWMRDHRNRYWLIAIEQFDPRRRVVPNHDWAHDYTVRALQFMGPMNPDRWDRAYED